ncbi:MAG: tyrosine-type recombinase/integrase, partial [Candidatus Nitrosotenuis sp.]
MQDIPEFLTEEQFYAKALKKSNSVDSEKNRRLHMAALKRFCRNARNETIEELGQFLREQNNVRKTCNLLNQFIEYLTKETGTMRVEGKRSHTVKIKPKSPTSAARYVTTARSYLKLCHGVVINDDDLKDYVDRPKDKSDDSEEAEPFKKDELKLVIESCQDQRRKSLYLFMSQTGARLAETMQIRKKYIDFAKDPVEVRLPRIITKGKKKGRTNFVDKAVAQRIKLLTKPLRDDDLVFTDKTDLILARNNEEQSFRRLCNELGFTERYESNNRYKKNIQSIRSFCMTQYALANNSEDAGHAYVGHSRYLDQYM